jgi:hypothetical protein
MESTEDRDFLDWLERHLVKIEKKSKKIKTDGTNLQNLQWELDEFSHLVEDLDVYLNKEERRVQRLLKWKNFFKRRPRRM